MSALPTHTALHVLTCMPVLTRLGAELRPVHRAPAAQFLLFDEALRIHEALQQSGFMLRDTARVYRSGLDWTVRLVWRRERDRESAVLCLRLRVPVRT